MATRKVDPEPKPEDGMPDIDQESMTTALADQTRPDLDGEPAASLTNVVRYTGLVSERRISEEEWREAGVSGQDGVVWTKDTGHVVPLDRFSEAALVRLAHSGEFQVIRESDQEQ